MVQNSDCVSMFKPYEMYICLAAHLSFPSNINLNFGMNKKEKKKRRIVAMQTAQNRGIVGSDRATLTVNLNFLIYLTEMYIRFFLYIKLK